MTLTDAQVTRKWPTNAPTYASTSEGTVSSGTTGAATVRVAHLWHPAAEKTKIRVCGFTISWAGGVGGDPVQFRVYKTTALGTPGATNKTITQIGGPAQSLDSTTRFYAGHTGDPTRGGIVANAVVSLASPGSIEFASSDLGDGEGFSLDPLAAGGYEIVCVTGTAGPTTAAAISVDVIFTAGSR